MDLPSVLGGLAQGFKDFGTSVVDLFGTGGAAIGDLLQGTGTRNQDDFRKWLYNTNSVQDAAAKGLGTALNGVQTVSDYIPGIGAVTRNPLFNAAQGALGGLADEFKMNGENYDLGRAGQRAAVSGAAALAGSSLGDALKKSANPLLKSGLAQGLARGATGGAINQGGYAAIDGGDVWNSALQGAGMGALFGGATGLAQELRPRKLTPAEMALTDSEKQARVANIDDQLSKLDTSTPEGNARYNELMNARDNYSPRPRMVDNTGQAVPQELAERLANTSPLVRDENGNLMRFYHGTPDGSFDTFRDGSYFTPDRTYADTYQNPQASSISYGKQAVNPTTFETYLDIRKPFDISDPEARRVYIDEYIKGGNAMGINPYQDNYDDIKNIDWTEVENLSEFLRDGKYGYDALIADEGGVFDNAGNVVPRGKSYIPFSGDQVITLKKNSGISPETTKKLEKILSASEDAINNPKYLTDENGNPRTFYHGSPNKNITEFDINQAGKNTSSGERALYFTDSPEVADEFSYERLPSDSMFVNNRGAKGRVYPVNLAMDNPLDLSNLSDKQIEELWQYASPLGKLDGKEKFIKNMKAFRDYGNDQLIKTNLDLDKLANSQYDGFTARMYPNQDNQAREYAVFDNSKVKMLEDVLANDDAAVNAAKLTPEQEAYFKDSVIRDENGNLMPMYHGTRGNFTVFGDNAPSDTSNSHASVGNWFTPTKDGAKNFAESIWYGDGEPTVMETYLNVKNPKVYETVDNSKAVEALTKELREMELNSNKLSDTELYSKNIYDASMAQRMLEQEGKDTTVKWLSGKGYGDEKAAKLVDEIAGLNEQAAKKKALLDKLSELKYSDAYQRFKTDIYKMDGQTAEDANVGGTGMALNDRGSIKKYVDKLKSEGYDGIIIKGTRYDADTMGGPNDQYVVFDSNQIKDINNLKPTSDVDIMASRMTPDEMDLARALARQDMAVNSAKIAPGQLGLFDDLPTQTPKTGTRQTSLFDQPQEGLDYYGGDIEMPAPANGLISREMEDLTRVPIDPATLPKGWEKARELADMGKRAKQIVLDPNDPHRALNEYNAALYSDAQYNHSMPVADIIDRLGSRQLSTEIDRGAARILADQLDESGDEFAKQFVTGASEVGGNIGHYKDAPKAEMADQRVSELLNIGRSNSMLSDSLAKPTSRNALGDQWKGTINIKGNDLTAGSDTASSVLWHERMHAFQDAENMGYDKRVVDAYNDLREDLAKLQHDNKQILRDHGDDAKYWGKPIEQEARMAQHYLDSKHGVNNPSKVYAHDSKGKLIRVDDNGQELNPDDLLNYYTGKTIKRSEYEAEDKQITAAFDKFIEKLQGLSKQGVALPAMATLFGGVTLQQLLNSKEEDKKKTKRSA